ncbi:hypothetical protein CSC88_39010, partial [Klebsiella pneumoniae]
SGGAAEIEHVGWCGGTLRGTAQGGKRWGEKEWENKHARRAHNQSCSGTHKGHEADKKDQRQKVARRRSHVQLESEEGFDGIRDRTASNQQERVAWVGIK